MPEYLAPGVFVEEVSFRSKSIEGVPTSTTGFAGLARFGPVWYQGGPSSCEPRLITSFTEYERVYGGLEPLSVGEPVGTERYAFMAHAARAFFANGGKRLYISRVFSPRTMGATPADNAGVAAQPVAVPTFPSAAWRARWPGSLGNVHVAVSAVRTKNVAFTFPAGDARAAWGAQARQVKQGTVVEIINPAPAPPLPGAPPPAATPPPLDPITLYVVNVLASGQQQFISVAGAVTAFPSSPLPLIQIVELSVAVTVDAERVDHYDRLATHVDQVRYIGKILDRDDPADENAVVSLEIDETPFAANMGYAAALAAALERNPNSRLVGGHDGVMPPIDATHDSLAGRDASPDIASEKATGLAALAEIDDIAIVALPDGGTYPSVDKCAVAAGVLITHAENCRYRIAIVDAPAGSSMTEIRHFRGKFDSKYAALYHPWIEIFDPLQRPAQGAPPDRLVLPASGFVAGIYARSDIERGVHKAPANEVVRGLTRFEANINRGRNEVLNPEGINALRFFEGRGNRVWGARTLSSDPEWKYVNVRRLFIYLEHSIDKSTQWAVFEPNNERLWANIRYTVEDFLYVAWRDGALMGEKPEEAYFVRCDRTTMSQNDLDNGRLICLIGVSPTKPAEFVIFRIGQWTGDAKRS